MNINQTDIRNSTALHWAVYEGNEIAATYLLAWGANVNLHDNDGNTPLHLSIIHAEKEHNSRLTKILLLKGADRNSRNNKGLRPIDMIGSGDMRNEL